MLPLMCIIALCGLLSPSQGHHEEAVAQITLCHGTIGELLSGLMDGDMVTSLLPEGLLPLGGLLGSKKGKGGGLGGGPVSKLLNTVTSTVGLQIKEASLAKVEVRMLPGKIALTLTTCIKVQLDLSTVTGLLKALPLDVGNIVGAGPLELSVKLVTEVPLLYSKSKEHPIKLILDQKNCKALQLSIKIKGDKGGSGVLSTVTSALEDTLGGSLTECLGNLLSPLICDTVLPTVLGLLNDKLSLLGGILPLGVIGDTVEYAVKGIKEVVGDCLVIDVNAAAEGELIAIDDGSSHTEIPPIGSDGIVMAHTLIKKLCAAQLTKRVINARVLKKQRITIDVKTVQTMFPEMVDPEALLLTITVEAEPEFTLDKGSFMMKITITINAYGEDTRDHVFKLQLDAFMVGALSYEDNNIVIKLDLESVKNIQVISSKCSISVEMIRSFIESCVRSNVVDVIKGVNIMIPIPGIGQDLNDCHIEVKATSIVIIAKNVKGQGSVKLPEHPQMPGMPQIPGGLPLPGGLPGLGA